MQACRDLAKKLDPPKSNFFTVEHLYISMGDSVKYTMRVQCSFLDVSWKLAAHRYSDFEQLHKSAACITKADLPPKYLLLASRFALLQRAAGLQNYCNELLRCFCDELLLESCCTYAPVCAELVTFFELDRMDMHHKQSSNMDQQATTIEKLKTVYREFVANDGKHVETPATMKPGYAETEAQGLHVKQFYRSPKRLPFEQCPSNVERTAASKRMRGSAELKSAPPAQVVEQPKLPLSARERLVKQPNRPPSSGLPSSSEQDIIASGPPSAAESSTAAVLWSPDTRAKDEANSVAGVRLQRSGISDVVGMIAL